MNNNDFEKGGVLMHILWATSVIKLEKQVAANRQKLIAEFNAKIAADPDDESLIEKKNSCLVKFDEANADTLSNVERARQIFAENPEFSGLLL